MTRENASARLSRFVAQLSYEDIDGRLTDMMKDWMIDTIGCGMAGGREASNTILVDTFRYLSRADGSAVWGQGLRMDIANAAMLNGALSHTVEMDDDHREGTIHTAVVVIPTVLALGENLAVSGQQALTAAVAGYEVGIRIGKAFLGNLFYQGFHPTGVCGVFAAAAAAGKLLGLDEEQMNHAFGIAGSQASGNREWKTTGAWTKRLQAGHANQAGINAALLAKKGFTGPRDFLEGQYGLFNSYAYQKKFDITCVTQDLGDKYELINNSLKPHASCRFAQPVIDSTLELVKTNDLMPEDIRRVSVGVGKNALISLTEPAERKYRPLNRVDAQFSLPYAAAVSIHRRRAFIHEYQPESFTDEEILSTARKVDYHLDPWAEDLWPRCYAASVAIETVDGARYFTRVDYPKGDPENPLSPEEIAEKFALLMEDAGRAGDARCLTEMIRGLEKLGDVNKLTTLLL